MMVSLRAALVVVLLSSATPLSAATADETFKALYTREWNWRKAIDGETPGAGGGRIRLARADLASQIEREKMWTQVLADLKAIDPATLSVDAAEDYAVYKQQVETLLANQTFREFEKPIYGDNSFWGNMSTMGRRNLTSEQDARDYIALLNDLPRFFAENVTNMRAGLKRGFTPPAITLEAHEAPLVAVANAKRAEDTGFWKPFVALPDTIAPATQEALRAEARAAIMGAIVPAYRETLTFFHGEYRPKAREPLSAESMPNGKAYYQSRIREFTTLEMSADEIHAIGLKAVADIRAQMMDIVRETKFDGDLPAFLTFLRTDPRFYAKTPEELLREAAVIAKQFDAVVPRYFGHLPRQRFAIIEVPPDIAPFYTSGRGGPGAYLVNTYDLPSRPLYSLRALTLHESAPGHAFQMPLAAENKRQPDFRREVYASAYGEGWALYAEKLGLEMGMYPTPYDRFGMLSYQMWRAVRLVVDTGIHHKGWTREQTRKYLRDNTALSERELVNEVDRYISYPGQACAFYLGQMTIEKARAKAAKALGDRFDIRAFHDVVLELGSVPLPVLEARVDRFIAEGGKSPYADEET